MIDVAVKYLQGTRLKEITQTELLVYVSKRTNCSHESVRGSIIGGGKKLFGQESFKKHWVVCFADLERGKKKRFIRRRYLTPEDKEVSIGYDTAAKQTARERGMSYLKKGKKPLNVITLAATEGYCVKAILNRCPNASITNVERDPEVLKAWQGKSTPTNDVCMKFSDFVHTKEFEEGEYAFMNADFMGYASGWLHDMLEHVNKLANVKTVVLTVLGIKNFRNHGRWVDAAKAKYKSDDPTKEWIEDIMDKYSLVDSWFYVRDPEQGSRSMRMFVLEVAA
jgi:hypothetical protein